MHLLLKNLSALLFSLGFCVLVSFLLNHFALLPSKNWPYGIIFLLLLSFILNVIYALKAGTADFPQLLIGAIVVKLLLTLIAVVIASFFIEKAEFFNFAIQFCLHYILFTLFEIRYLLHILKTHPISRN